MTQPRGTARRQLTGSDIRSLLMGQGVSGLSIVAQAYRIRPADTDEVIRIAAGGDHWVASRIGDAVAIWACTDADAAADKFEQFAAGDGWILACPAAVAATADVEDRAS